MLDHGNGVLTGNVITGNQGFNGAGVALGAGTFLLSQNTLTDNNGGNGGGCSWILVALPLLTRTPSNGIAVNMAEE